MLRVELELRDLLVLLVRPVSRVFLESTVSVVLVVRKANKVLRVLLVQLESGVFLENMVSVGFVVIKVNRVLLAQQAHLV